MCREVEFDELGDGSARTGGPLVVHVLSDALGETGLALVRAAAIQFRRESVVVSRLTHVEGMEEVRRYLDRYVSDGSATVLFHTILDEGLREELRQEAEERGMATVDLLGPSLSMLERLLGEAPMDVPGLVVERESRLVRSIDARRL